MQLIRVFTITWLALQSLAATAGGTVILKSITAPNCEGQVTIGPALRDPREIVSFGSGTYPEYVAQIQVAESLVGKRLSQFWPLGPNMPLGPVTIRKVNNTYEFGERGYNLRGVQLEFVYGAGATWSTSLWDILLFQSHIENWSPPTVLKDSPQIDFHGGFVAELSDASQAELLHEGVVPAVGERIVFAQNSSAGNWAKALNVEFFHGQVLSLKTGVLVEEDKFVKKKNGQFAVVFTENYSPEKLETTARMYISQVAIQVISKDLIRGGHDELHESNIQKALKWELPAGDGTHFNLAEYLADSFKRHKAKLVILDEDVFPRIERGANETKVILGSKSSRADLVLAWTKLISLNENDK